MNALSQLREEKIKDLEARLVIEKNKHKKLITVFILSIAVSFLGLVIMNYLMILGTVILLVGCTGFVISAFSFVLGDFPINSLEYEIDELKSRPPDRPITIEENVVWMKENFSQLEQKGEKNGK